MAKSQSTFPRLDDHRQGAGRRNLPPAAPAAQRREHELPRARPAHPRYLPSMLRLESGDAGNPGATRPGALHRFFPEKGGLRHG